LIDRKCLSNKKRCVQDRTAAGRKDAAKAICRKELGCPEKWKIYKKRKARRVRCRSKLTAAVFCGLVCESGKTNKTKRMAAADRKDAAAG